MSSFSVLLPVYAGDHPDYFERALRSIGADQLRAPDEIFVICDGPVPAPIDALLEDLAEGKRRDLTGGVEVTVHRLEKNSGLTDALNAGIEHCQHDIIARADADDIAVPERFKVQLPLMENHDLVGSAIVEFDTDEHENGMVRRMPEKAEDIRRIVTYRDPFNHPTVMYRRQAVASVGGYEHVNHMEDYWLFARMVMAGIPCCNTPEALVRYRTGSGAYQRRGGWTMLRSELALQRRLWSDGIISPRELIRNVLIRGTYRLIPSSIRQFMYRTVGTKRWFIE
ncbi:MAG: glycosyl transferase [Actinobacteria bacterium]|nr:MAG: glycosyl transferase [Actinomycetota bacterium]